MKILAILQAPAEYTLDLVKNVYAPRGVDCVFMQGESVAGEENAADPLNAMPPLKRVKRLWRLLSEYDAFNLNGYTGSTCAMFIILNAFFFRKPFSIDSDTQLRIPSNPLKRIAKRLWLGFVFTRKFCFGFAGGNFSHKDLFRHYGMPENRIFLAPMVIDNARFAPERRIGGRAHGSPFRFGFVGRLVSIKQVDKIIEAIGRLAAEGLNVSLDVVGDGPEYGKLEAATKGYPVGFTGALHGDAKIKKMQSFDCLVLYSTTEAWGLVVNESLSCGVPVVVSDAVGARYDLVEGENPTGLVAKSGDVDDLTDKMREISTNGALWRSLCENAASRMRVWNYGLYAENYDLWKNVVASR